MKIIKQGELELTCPRCNTTFAIEGEDWKTIVRYGTIDYVPAFLPGTTKAKKGLYTSCPTCNRLIEITNE